MFAAVAVRSALRSDGFFDPDALVHFERARWAWTDPTWLTERWARPGFTIPYAAVAGIGSITTACTLAKLLSVALMCASTVFAAGTASRLGCRRPELAAALLMLMPLHFRLGFTTLTETTCAFYLSAGTWLLVTGRERSAALLLGLAPLARHEVGALLPPLLLYFVARRAMVAGMLSLVPLIAWNIADYFVTGILPFSETFADRTSSLYGTGSPWHFIACWMVAAGPLAAPVSFAGAAVALVSRPTTRARAYLLPALGTLGAVALHTVLFAYNRVGSGGYARFLVAESPWMAICGAMAVEQIISGLRRGVAPRAVVALTAFGAAGMGVAVWAVRGQYLGEWRLPLVTQEPRVALVFAAIVSTLGLVAVARPRRWTAAVLCGFLLLAALPCWSEAARRIRMDAMGKAIGNAVKQVRTEFPRERHRMIGLTGWVPWFDDYVVYRRDPWPPVAWTEGSPGLLYVYGDIDSHWYPLDALVKIPHRQVYGPPVDGNLSKVRVFLKLPGQ